MSEVGKSRIILPNFGRSVNMAVRSAYIYTSNENINSYLVPEQHRNGVWHTDRAKCSDLRNQKSDTRNVFFVHKNCCKHNIFGV